jgi:hypothetical protein
VMGGAIQMAGLLFKLQREGFIDDPAQMLADYARMISSDTDDTP